MNTIIRAAVAYIVLFLVMRLIGRRAVDQMTPIDLIVIFLIGGMTIQAVVTDDRSLTNAILGVMTVGAMHVLVAWLKSLSNSFGRIADGTPIVIYDRGTWHDTRLKKLRINKQDVMAAARQNGVERVEEIQYANIERNGAISIIREDAEMAEQADEQNPIASHG